MALDAADWTIAVNGDIRWTGAGTATNVTVLEFHRWLQDLADDAVAASASSDLLDITDDTPSDRATDNIITLLNGYNITDTEAQHIFDGSIARCGCRQRRRSAEHPPADHGQDQSRRSEHRR
jgi:hypothetical protein